MRQLVFVIKDIKVGFGTPFFAISQPLVYRDLERIINSESDSDMARYPQDMQLYALGTFETSSGKLETRDPEFLIELNEFKKQEEK